MTLGIKTNILTSLQAGRQRGGLTPARLKELITPNTERSEASWCEFANCTFIAALAEELKVSTAQALLQYLRAVAARLPADNTMIVDQVLNLQMDATQQYADDLGNRRDALRKRLPRSGANSTYRKNLEEPTLVMFASSLDQPLAQDIQAMGLDPSSFKRFLEPKREQTTLPNVVVLGGAVMDINFHIPHMPERDASVQARGYRPFPRWQGTNPGRRLRKARHED